MTTIDPKGWYHALGIAPGASLSEVRAGFRRQAKHQHPDAGGDADAFRRLREVYDKLSDPRIKSAYDASFADALARRRTRDPAPIAAGIPAVPPAGAFEDTPLPGALASAAAAAYARPLRRDPAGRLIDTVV